jgi:hypothetical protein
MSRYCTIGSFTEPAVAILRFGRFHRVLVQTAKMSQPRGRRRCLTPGLRWYRREPGFVAPPIEGLFCPVRKEPGNRRHTPPKQGVYANFGAT